VLGSHRYGTPSGWPLKNGPWHCSEVTKTGVQVGVAGELQDFLAADVDVDERVGGAAAVPDDQ